MLRVLLMITIKSDGGRRSDYSRADLAQCARGTAKIQPDSDGKVRAWYITVHAGPSSCGAVQLCVDYLTRDGEPCTATVAL